MCVRTAVSKSICLVSVLFHINNPPLVSSANLYGSSFNCYYWSSWTGTGCEYDTVNCNSGADCYVYCPNGGSCRRATINCPSNANCYIYGQASYAGRYATINCNGNTGSATCYIYGQTTDSFDYATINCPNSDNDRCVLEGDATDAFEFAEINCRDANSCELYADASNAFDQATINGDTATILRVYGRSSYAYQGESFTCPTGGSCFFYGYGNAYAFYQASIMTDDTASVWLSSYGTQAHGQMTIDARNANNLYLYGSITQLYYQSTAYCPADGQTQEYVILVISHK